MMADDPLLLHVVNSSAQSKAQALKLEKKLLHYTQKAIADYKMIQAKDRVLVCLSGGKDSFSLLWLIHKLSYKFHFEFEAFTLDQSQPGWDDSTLRAFLTAHRIPYTILTRNTYKVVKEKIPQGKTYCSLCARLRRGNIYQFAKENGFNKVALGHHREDLLETLLMSLFYNGQIRSMPPKLLTDDKQLVVIRPLVYCQERDLAQYALNKAFPIIPCNLCGSQDNLARQRIKKLLGQLAKENPKVPSNMLHALQHIAPSQLMDKSMWDFEGLEESQVLHDVAQQKDIEYGSEPIDNA